jgi:hypothetical protein
VWFCASSVPLARIRRPQRILEAITRSPPFTLHSAALPSSPHRSSLSPGIPLHGQPSFVELWLVQLGDNSYPGSSPRGPAVGIREATDTSTKRRTVTRNLLLVERGPNDLVPIPLHTLYTRQAATRRTAHGTAPPKRHVVQQRYPQVQQIVTDPLPIL